MIDVIERARRYIAKCPAAISGQNGHGATFHVAALLVWGFGLSLADALMLLREWNGSCQPPWCESDLIHKIQSAANATHREARGYLLGKGTDGSQRSEARGQTVALPPKPVFCPMVLKRVAAKAEGVMEVAAWLQTISPLAVAELDAAQVLARLYPTHAGENVLVFSDMRSQGQMLWRAKDGPWLRGDDLPSGPEGVWFLPQPVDGKYHPNPRMGGKQSRRSEESVTAWRYAVLESDEAEPEDWLRCLIQMPLRIACICESGGRSTHGLVRLDAASKQDWDEKIRAIKPVVVTLGADAGALSAVRLTRLPQARRGKRVQRLLYLNPTPEPVPILLAGGQRKEVT